MIHKNCGGKIHMDVTGLYKLVSPALNITTSGITPGVVELFSKGGGSVILLCEKCEKTFSNKEVFRDEILDTCSVCGEEFSPDDLLVSDFIPKLCVNCKTSGTRSTKNTRATNTQDKLLQIYGEYISNHNLPTLLTVLLKKI